MGVLSRDGEKKQWASEALRVLQCSQQDMNAEKFPIPAVEELIENMAGGHVFSKLDLFAGHWQIRLAEHVEEITTFTFKYGLFQFCVLLLGLMNATGMLQRMAREMFRDLSYVKVYIEDIFMTSVSLEDYVLHLFRVSRRVRQTGLRLRLRKRFFALREIPVLEHFVNVAGVMTNSKKLARVSKARISRQRTGLIFF